jgi:hypothetical protein
MLALLTKANYTLILLHGLTTNTTAFFVLIIYVVMVNWLGVFVLTGVLYYFYWRHNQYCLRVLKGKKGLALKIVDEMRLG